jgi:hypothetical protein
MTPQEQAGQVWCHRWRQSMVRRAVAPLGQVRELWVEPGRVHARIAEGGGGPEVEVWILVDPLGGAFRQRWRRALGQDPAFVPPWHGRLLELVDTQPDLDPTPPADGCGYRCSAHQDARYCGHVAAACEEVGMRILADPSVLWRLRGLEAVPSLPAQPKVLRGRPAALAPEAPAPPRVRQVRPGEFWGSTIQEVPGEWAFAPWVEEPYALRRLGPLPVPRGQGEAAEPLLARYRAVRDALAAWWAGGRSRRKGWGVDGQGPRGGGTQPEDAPNRTADIAALWRQGLSRPEIARRLGLPYHAVWRAVRRLDIGQDP